MASVRKHCVIGHGLTGTAAAKYLAALGEDVVLVGPSEASGAHGACYDEGRIYRILDPNESWARLAEKSIGSYKDIESASGIDFFQESGLLIWGVEDSFVKQTREVARRMRTPLEELTPDQMAALFPFLGMPASTQIGLWQSKQAGHLSPRKLTAAQLACAKLHGAEYMDAPVVSVSQKADGGTFRVALADGGSIEAENVLVAAGVYTSVLPLLPEQIVVNLTGSQAMLVELSEDDAASLLKMPSMIYEGETEDDCFYLLPPILYPDGKWLVKIGPSTSFAPPLKTGADVDAWFRRGHLDPTFERVALAMLLKMLPHVTFGKSRALLCVTDNTPTENAYIDYLKQGWGICSGGNGVAAKSSDAIGRLAAQMMALPGHWGPDPDLPRSWFRAVTPTSMTPTPQLETPLARVEACGGLPDGREAVEALAALTLLAAQTKHFRSRPAAAAEALRGALAEAWGTAPSVMCFDAPRGSAWAPSHPFVALSSGSLFFVVVLQA